VPAVIAVASAPVAAAAAGAEDTRVGVDRTTSAVTTGAVPVSTSGVVPVFGMVPPTGVVPVTGMLPVPPGAVPVLVRARPDFPIRGTDHVGGGTVLVLGAERRADGGGVLGRVHAFAHHIGERDRRTIDRWHPVVEFAAGTTECRLSRTACSWSVGPFGMCGVTEPPWPVVVSAMSWSDSVPGSR
jgi:hypothetical protein